MIIRPLDESALESVLEVYRQCEDFLALGPQPCASEAMVLADIRHSRESGCTFCGIFSGAGRLIGVLDYCLDGVCGQPTDAYLSLLMIIRSERSRGWGEQAVRWYEDLAYQHGARLLGASCQANNPRGLAFWQRMGYTIYTEPALQPDGTTAVDMHKQIANPNSLLGGTSI